ncbi:MAG: DUF4276 family protein [Bacteroidales bacterium]
MKRLIIICEGQTEQEFCKTILSPYLTRININIRYPLIKKSNGGIVAWLEFKKEISQYLKDNTETYVTCLIDYYGINKRHKFPKWEIANAEPDKNQRMRMIEQGMKEDLAESIRYRFIPYVQLHEFEGLIFSGSINVFREQIPQNELTGEEELLQTLDQFSNPEMINDDKETSPSHRLERIIKGYNKIVYGNILLEAIGLEGIRNKCPRFNEWVDSLVNID